MPAPQPLADQVSPLPQPSGSGEKATPPPALSIEQAGSGLTVPEISELNGHSEVAIYAAIKRHGIAHLVFKNTIRLYSADQADFLLRNMRSPDNGSGKKRTKTGQSCPHP